jgi:aminoglycoside 3-N-acetyltransferase I
MYTYHRLASSDQAQACALMDVFAVAFAEPETYQGHRASDDYLARVLSKPDVIVLVAHAAGTVVGGLVAYQLEKLEQARSEIYIYDLAVDEAHRRRGIATALINMLGDIARELGAWVMFVQADPGDEPALSLYASLGRREDVYHFDIPPAPRAPTAHPLSPR